MYGMMEQSKNLITLTIHVLYSQKSEIIRFLIASKVERGIEMSTFFIQVATNESFPRNYFFRNPIFMNFIRIGLLFPFKTSVSKIKKTWIQFSR